MYYICRELTALLKDNYYNIIYTIYDTYCVKIILSLIELSCLNCWHFRIYQCACHIVKVMLMMSLIKKKQNQNLKNDKVYFLDTFGFKIFLNVEIQPSTIAKLVQYRLGSKLYLAY